ncbi:MAG: hypothetical protein GX639_22375 [Fibrobacter sp.]|nr:hypothetical protein [Fibrobacter sp.]
MFYKKDDSQSMERYSSAVTLSDMEVFIFPELLYALMLANIMSPRLWKWKNDPWFNSIHKAGPVKRMQRLKQYIMDHFSFNLDLDTWGLTDKNTELSRFNAFINQKILSESNALFGYEGDKYYFDIDIRKHFGLDKYNSDVIPYWKTETLEAMEAFRYKDGYPAGAGECVSLAALYASGSFVVGDIPLQSIYLFATPLHSQNFIDIKDGIITNNRRIVTKNMWYNGTELSAKARRALENEKVTIVANNTGYIHTMYNTATINPDSYKNFRNKIKNYLKTEITFEILANFLRQNSQLQCCFQIAHSCCGKPRYLPAERAYQYEHSSKFRVGDTTQENLLHEIEEDEYYTSPLPHRMILDELELFFNQNKVIVDSASTIELLQKYLHHECINVVEVVEDLITFCKTNPRLPDTDKEWIASEPINLDNVKNAQEALEKVSEFRTKNISADLAFSAFRDLSRSPWKPFLKAAFERNPVTLHALRNEDIQTAFTKINALENESIYDESTRLAQPDEVWNFGRGDGLEKALCFINILKKHFPQEHCTLDYSGKKVNVKVKNADYTFTTTKQLNPPSDEDFLF